MTTPAALRELADRLTMHAADCAKAVDESTDTVIGVNQLIALADDLCTAATQLRAAASEGGEAVGYTSESALRTLAAENASGVMFGTYSERYERTIPLFTHPPEVARDAFVAEWARRFGFLASKHDPSSIESIDEVACYLLAKDDARDAADAERWRTLRDSLPREYNHDKDKGYIRWYLPRARGGFMGLQEHIDSIISSKAATSDAALRARAVG